MIAEQLGMSKKYLSNFFSEQIGISFSNYLTNLRMKKANELLLNTDMKIREISEAVGYRNVNSFVRFYKKHEGVTPGELRKVNQKE
jgi:two-component system, response regulator YesN